MSDDIKIVKMQSGKIGVESPYSTAFVDAAHGLAGKWQAPYWLFDGRDEAAVREALVRIYGRDDKPPAQTVDVEISLDEWWYDGGPTMTFGGLRVAHRPGRDQAVRLGGGAVIKAGGFSSSGGSVKNPRLEPKDGTILLVRDVPAGHIDLQDKGATVVSVTVDKAALGTERAELVARIAEIDKLLEG